MQKIFVNKDLESFNEDFLKHNAASLQHLLSGWCLAPGVKMFMAKSYSMMKKKVWQDDQTIREKERNTVPFSFKLGKIIFKHNHTESMGCRQSNS